MKIIHIIPTLGDGGAEATLDKICRFDKNNEHIVICLIGGGKYKKSIEDAGVKVHTLGIRSFPYFPSIFTLFSLIKRYNADVVQTWMYHADFLGGIIAKVVGCKSIVWNVRHSCLSPKYTKRQTIILARFCAILSKFIPNDIIYCGIVAKNEHVKIGYNKKLFKIVPNGYDFSIYKPQEPSSDFKKRFSQIDDDYIRFGKLARYTPEKNHNHLLESFSLLKNKMNKFYLFLAGKGIDYENKCLVKKISELNLSDNVFLIGQVCDSIDFMNFIDVNIQSSSSEGFPNVLVEALACGTPCIATDVGDSQYIISEPSVLVPSNNKQQLSEAAFAFSTDFKRYSFKSNFNPIDISMNVIDLYSVEVMIERYNEVWNECL
ncbi:TPA: glycosyltransferase [Vibrio vulnificus]|nr:glycosyltransferase [Vibrio vulnificus]HDY8076101.1 glycosyltransferase [Vibrio vulnificus]